MNAKALSLKSIVSTLLLIAATSILSTTSIVSESAAIAPNPTSDFSSFTERFAQAITTDLEARMDRGVDALDAGNYAEALEAFEQAIAFFPTHALAHIGKGFVL